MEQLSKRIVRDKITIEHRIAEAPAHIDYKWASNSTWYAVTLRMGTRKLAVPFGMGIGLQRDPDVMDVLSCLISDASSAENADSYHEWCHELGMDPADNANRRTYGAILTNTSKLKKFLGDKYHAYLSETEDDG